jgi:pyridinium-3,5-bisthiocarboxylic acid mononucleotide nickel chelatase
MRLAYLDCVGGLAGDMFLAALLDAGADGERLQALPEALGIHGADVLVTREERHGIGALHVEIRAGDDAPYRNLATIRDLLEQAALDAYVRGRALEVFERLAGAEAAVHGVAVEDVQFHELGAVDTVMDVCGVVALLADLGVEALRCSPLPTARGLARTAHGRLPLPAPATLELLKGAPLTGVEEEGELVTPTGAALASTLASGFGALPTMTLERIGYGAGTRDTAERPNLVRVLVGEALAAGPSAEVSLLETNLDDLLPELVPDAVERCLAVGALDVWTVPAQMKKGRPGIVLSALARPGDEAAVAGAILEETSALGVRVGRLRRYELEREETSVRVGGERVRVKLGRLDGRLVNVAPEHDDCAAAARRLGRPVKSVWAAALAAAQER